MKNLYSKKAKLFLMSYPFPNQADKSADFSLMQEKHRQKENKNPCFIKFQTVS
jgi:hypothetical protein